MKRKFILISFVVLIIAAISAVSYFKASANQVSADNSGQITSQISVAYGSATKTERWEAIDGYAGRFPVNLGETLHLSMQLSRLEIGKPVLIQAPHGGVLNGNQNHFSWTPQRTDESLELNYQVGQSCGVYLISLRQGQREEVIEFWAGEEKPLGETGPQNVEAQ
ncbi:MAG: hypothetical protein R3F23_07970 [Verrucomicrobiia bacterium]